MYKIEGNGLKGFKIIVKILLGDDPMSETHLNDLKYRLMTIDLLRTAKRNYTYRELSIQTGLPVTVLSRYVKGHVLPTSSRARKIWKSLEKIVGLEEELRRRIKFDTNGYFDNTSIISDPTLLQQGAQYVFSKFAGRRITKVLTAAVDGIPLATIISEVLGVDLVIAKKNKEVGVRDFIEETFVPGGSGMVTSLYLPRGLIKRSDSVLIVDDVIKSGETPKALVRLIKKARAEVAGIYALISIGDRWKEKLRDLQALPIEVVLNLRPSK
jgi:adenine/guanine phosphoribosyltransferase-like PRPP-binding protein